MTPAALVEQELAAAQAAQQDHNDGKARVCSRRAVARATEAWGARLSFRNGAGMRWHVSSKFSRTRPSLFLSVRRPSD